MSLTTAPKKKSMRQYYLKKPAKGSTTAYICHQVYNHDTKHTDQVLVASFNVATDPASPTINVTEKGAADGYLEVPADHLIEVQKWLKKNGTRGKFKVPPTVLARVRAEAEAQVRAELKVAAPVPPTASSLESLAVKPQTLGDKLSAMLGALDQVKSALAETAGDKPLRLSPSAASDWRMCSFAFSEVLDLVAEGKRGMGRPKAWQSVDWSAEADARGYTTSKTRASRAAAAKKAAASDSLAPGPAGTAAP